MFALVSECRLTIVAVLMAAFAVACAMPRNAAAAPGAQRLPPTPLFVLNGAAMSPPFMVEVARTDSEQEIGLMYRETLGPRAGMLFPFASARPAIFWMKNTFIPLDMVFIARGGRVESVLEHVEPLTLAPRSSRGAVIAVLELDGGSARAHGIRRGSIVCHESLRPSALCRKALAAAGNGAP